jgi:hypothetical protein
MHEGDFGEDGAEPVATAQRGQSSVLRISIVLRVAELKRSAKKSMRPLLKIALIATVICGLVSCATSPKDSNLITDHRWIGGAISLEARRLDANSYDIVAQGAGACKEAQVMKAWIDFADKLAVGRKYEKSTRVEPYNYSASGGMMTTHHTGLRVIGSIALK